MRGRGSGVKGGGERMRRTWSFIDSMGDKIGPFLVATLGIVAFMGALFCWAMLILLLICLVANAVELFTPLFDIGIQCFKNTTLVL